MRPGIGVAQVVDQEVAEIGGHMRREIQVIGVTQMRRMRGLDPPFRVIQRLLHRRRKTCQELRAVMAHELHENLLCECPKAGATGLMTRDDRGIIRPDR